MRLPGLAWTPSPGITALWHDHTPRLTIRTDCNAPVGTIKRRLHVARKRLAAELGDDTVDLALGTDFTDLSRGDDIDAVLASLLPEATQPADPALLSKIHTGAC